MGTVVVIGGGPTPENAVKDFIKAAGGPDSLLVILTQVQQDAAKGAVSSAEFWREKGARNIETAVDLPPTKVIELIHRARGVYIPGGDQNRFTKIFPESSGVPTAIRDVQKRGGVCGGTSAGASLMGSLMPTGEETNVVGLKVGATGVAPALEVVPNVIFDQHFLKRARFQRLVAAILEHPNHTGIGVDEEAYVVIEENTLTVRKGQVVVLKAASKVRREETMFGAADVRVKVLLPGDTHRL